MKCQVWSSSFFLILSLTLSSSVAEAIANQCATEPFTASTSNQGNVKFPASGRFVLESHLATKSDSFPNNRLFPNTLTEKIQDHLNNSCQEIKKINQAIDCDTVYKTKYHKEWTPPENGKAGEGSVGDLKPSVREEMFSGNMMWAGRKKPAPGTKFIASYQGKNVVVVMGYETGPSDSKFLGGLQGEVLYFLHADDNSKITIQKLKNQNLLPGPVECQNHASANISTVKFQKPNQGQIFSSKKPVVLEGTAASDVISVKLVADGKWELASIRVNQGTWSATYQFLGVGDRQITVLGFNSSGKQIATDTTSIRVQVDK